MKKFVLPLAAALTLFASPAFASHCPTDVAKIDAALAGNSSLSSEAKAQIMSLRNEGDAAHKAGDHAGAVEKLHQALEMLGMPHQ